MSKSSAYEEQDKGGVADMGEPFKNGWQDGKKYCLKNVCINKHIRTCKYEMYFS